MKKFEEYRINRLNEKIKGFKNPIPIIFFSPKNNQEINSVFIFVSGVGSTNNFAINMNYNFFDDKYLLTYEKAGHGENKNNPFKSYKKYVNELALVIEFVKKKFKNKKIFLLGESWGSCLSTLYCYKNINKISGAFLWNMPRIVLDPSKKPLSHKMIFGMKVIWTMLTNLPTYDRHPINSTEKLSSNKILIKMNKIVAPTKSSTKIIISVWLSMRPSWKKLIKILKNNPKNFFIFQSKDDFFFDEKNWKKCSKLFPNNLFFLNEGMHILSFEEPQNLMLFEKIDNLLSDISHEK